MRVFAVSDIHIDFEANASWISGLSRDDYQDDVLILAGDVADGPALLERCFRELAARFRKVLFVPGNHDLWVLDRETVTSFDKFEVVCRLAEDAGVSMQPYRVDSLAIVPLLGWYDYSFGPPSPDLFDRWMDYHACRWPAGFGVSEVTQHFLDMNAAVLNDRHETTISFSHFLPRIDLMPDFIPPVHRILYPVLGSALIEEQVRRLMPRIHVYGHSHFNRHVEIDGIAYINNALGYPREVTQKTLQCIFES